MDKGREDRLKGQMPGWHRTARGDVEALFADRDALRARAEALESSRAQLAAKLLAKAAEWRKRAATLKMTRSVRHDGIADGLRSSADELEALARKLEGE